MNRVALSVRQPWASAIVLGYKPIENRTWPPPPWLMDHTFAIHATKPQSRYELEVAFSAIAEILGRGEALARLESHMGTVGAIVGTATLRGASRGDAPGLCFSPEEAPWADGPWCWALRDARALRTPIPCRGQLGLWSVHEDIVAAMRADFAAQRESA